ncbi:unnamed protein product, partial [Discosporangium mesarthrocarpum]
MGGGVRGGYEAGLHPVEGGGTVTLSLVTFYFFAVVLGVMAVGIPSLVAARARPAVVGVIASVYTVGLLVAEVILVGAGSHASSELRMLSASSGLDLGEVYPLLFVLGTGGLGLWMVVTLRREWMMDPTCFWVAASVNAAKTLAAVMVGIVQTEADSPGRAFTSAVVPMTALVMSSTAPMALFKRSTPRGHMHSERRDHLGRAGPNTGAGRSDDGTEEVEDSMLPSESILCVTFMGIALWVSLDPIIVPVLDALMGAWIGLGFGLSGRRGVA